ncbi:MAG: tRNA (adenosine(37)-N6)-threonylcarbamoyltransferase complex ATPase subunit type 1 TsaE [Acidobacteriota bacterium]
MFNTKTKSYSPEETFTLAEKLGEKLKGGEIILLSGELGAGKTLFTKGVLHALNYDIDEVTSPSFTLVNLYKTEKFDVFHIDFWRLNEKADVAQAVGLDEIIEDETAIVIMEWSEKLRRKPFSGKIIEIKIEGDGDEPRMITVSAA